MKAALLTPRDAVQMMPMLRPFLDHFAERSRWRFDAHGLEADIADGRAQAWVVIDGDTLRAVCLTRITGQGGVVEIVACAGEGAEAWRDALLDAIEMFAREVGAGFVMPMVRPGWSKWLVSRGYRNTHREMERRL